MNLLKLASSLAAIIVSSGCGAPGNDEPEAATSAAQTSAFVEIPIVAAGHSFTTAYRSHSTVYLTESTRTACGGDYTIKMAVELGEVTTTSVHVRSVFVKYVAATSDITIVPTNLEVYGDAGNNVSNADEFLQIRHNGDTHRYAIDATFSVTESRAVVVDFHTAGGRPSGDSSDIACGQLARTAYTPHGA